MHVRGLVRTSTFRGGLLEKTGVTFLQFLQKNNLKSEVFKGYLRYKTIICHKVAIDV